MFAKVKLQTSPEEEEDLRPAVEEAEEMTDRLIEEQTKHEIREKLTQESETNLDVHPMFVSISSTL